MNTLLIYLLKSSICLGVLFLFYWTFLRRDTFFRLNRLFLLGAGFLSLMIPAIPFHRMLNEPVSSLGVFLHTVLITSGRLQEKVSGDEAGFGIPYIIYLTGVIIALSWFLARLMQLFMLIRKSKTKKEGNYLIILIDGNISPFSFFNRIFINERSVAQGDLGTILAHEHIHSKQFHTLDLILSELLTIVQWFNPFAWMISRELKRVHEYLADEGVIREGVPVPEYQQLVLNETMGIQVNNLANNFTISQVKNRIIMMTKKRSGNWSMSKALLAFPVIIATGLFFSASTNSLPVRQEKIQEKPQNKGVVDPDEHPSYPGGEKAMYAFMLENIKYPEEAKKAGAVGTVFISVNVEPDGRISEVKIIRGFRNDCDKEALRVVKLMPNWIPGKVNGKAVKTNFVLPIKFALDKKTQDEKKK
jgi:TonB family protein